jgi:hypothetical protein
LPAKNSERVTWLSVAFSLPTFFMSTAYPIVVCAGIVPDPLQTLEPFASPTWPALKNEMMLPAVLDPA